MHMELDLKWKVEIGGESNAEKFLSGLNFHKERKKQRKKRRKNEKKEKRNLERTNETHRRTSFKQTAGR